MVAERRVPRLPVHTCRGVLAFTAGYHSQLIDLPVPVDGILEEVPGNDAASAGLAH